MRSTSLVLALLLALATPSGAQMGGSSSTRAGTIATAVSAANAIGTLTLAAAGAGLFHYITSIHVVRTCTTAIVGSAVLTVTTTNLPGPLAFTSGNACPVGTTNEVVQSAYLMPIKASVANTATTIVCPAIGATGICRITAAYFTAN